MPQPSQAKTLGGVGSILVLLGAVPYVGAVLGIVGLILTLFAVKYISDIVGDEAIFNNMMISVVLAIVGIVVGAVFVVGAIFRFIGLGFMSGGFTGPSPLSNLPLGDIIRLISGIAIGLVAIWIFILVSAVFLRKSYGSVASKLHVDMFGTAALIYLIGAALAIVLVGFVLIFVAQILLIIAFFSIPDQLPQTQQSQPIQPSSPPM